MRRPSSNSDQLFRGLFGNPVLDAEISDQAWLKAMLDVEAALAAAEAHVGVIPVAAATEIAAACRSERFDLSSLGWGAKESGNPVVPLVRALDAMVSAETQAYVHLGATSQDILDTAISLLAQRALAVLLADLARAADTCAVLTRMHRSTVMPARTLLQQALPTTLGLKCAGWLVAVDESRTILTRVRDERLAIQLGGAAGTLASLEGAGVEVGAELARQLGLAHPTMPWHTNRVRVAELACALGAVSGVLGKIALDIILLAQTEVAEVAEGGGPSHGGSSTLPQKRNPVLAVLTVSVTRRVPGLVATILTTMAQEHERGAGGWHAEWETLTELLRLTGGAAAHLSSLLTDVVVDAEKMLCDVELGNGMFMAESVAHQLAKRMGKARAHELIQRCSRDAQERGVPLAAVLTIDQTVRSHLSEEQVAAALEPSAYLGSAAQLVERALDAHRSAGVPG